MNIDLREELRKRDELLDGYLKQIEKSLSRSRKK